MTRTVLEQELLRKLSEIRASLHMHDRGVFLGFVFSLLPIFPLALVGLCLGLFHRSMHKAGKINGFDYALVRRGLIFGAINSVLSLVVLAAVIHFASSLDWRHVLVQVFQRALDLIQFLWGRPSFVPTGGLAT